MKKLFNMFYYAFFFMLFFSFTGCADSVQPANYRMQARIEIDKETGDVFIEGIDRILKANGFKKIETGAIEGEALIYVDRKTKQQNFHIWREDAQLVVDAVSIPLDMGQSETVSSAFIGIKNLANRFDSEISAVYKDESKMLPRR